MLFAVELDLKLDDKRTIEFVDVLKMGVSLDWDYIRTYDLKVIEKDNSGFEFLRTELTDEELKAVHEYAKSWDYDRIVTERLNQLRYN